MKDDAQSVCHRHFYLIKVDVPNSVTYLNQTPIFERYVVGVPPKWIPKRHVFEKD